MQVGITSLTHLAELCLYAGGYSGIKGARYHHVCLSHQTKYQGANLPLPLFQTTITTYLASFIWLHQILHWNLCTWCKCFDGLLTIVVYFVTDVDEEATLSYLVYLCFSWWSNDMDTKEGYSGTLIHTSEGYRCSIALNRAAHTTANYLTLVRVQSC